GRVGRKHLDFGGSGSREKVSLSATDCYIVHETYSGYSGENAQDQFEYELEQALEAQYKYIVIEPTRIGDETAHWITVGNCLHKTTLLFDPCCKYQVEYDAYKLFRLPLDTLTSSTSVVLIRTNGLHRACLCTHSPPPHQ
ncbi:transmembrane protein 11, mitochondrial isoform X1, partial [Sigmodon hispidus]